MVLWNVVVAPSDNVLTSSVVIAVVNDNVFEEPLLLVELLASGTRDSVVRTDPSGKDMVTRP